MKKTILLLFVIGFCISALAQPKAKTKTSVKTSSAKKQVVAKKCPPLVVDIVKGTVNGLVPSASMAAIKAKLPCFTGETKEGEVFNCGGGVFFLNHDIFFYTKLDAIEIRGKYTGKFIKDGKAVSLIGMSKDDMVELLGEPDEDTETDEDNFEKLYELENGSTLRIQVEDGKVILVSLHAQAPSQIELCI